jgi:tRNA (cmo5U34)-methyltransferase
MTRRGAIAAERTVVAAGDGILAAPAGWHFSGETPRHFNTHVARSVPNYETGHGLIAQISDFFVKSDSVAYEIGTSTGTLVRRLATRHGGGSRWIGIDIEGAMIEQARAEHRAGGAPGNVEYVVADACEFDYEPCDFFVSYYTVQFVPPRRRQNLINAIYQALNWGGAFLLFEKVRAADARFQDIASALYVDFKLQNGYSPHEIVAKASSLKGVLEPFSTNGNLDMLRRAGFVDIMTVYKHICFEGFLAIK